MLHPNILLGLSFVSLYSTGQLTASTDWTPCWVERLEKNGSSRKGRAAVVWSFPSFISHLETSIHSPDLQNVYGMLLYMDLTLSSSYSKPSWRCSTMVCGATHTEWTSTYVKQFPGQPLSVCVKNCLKTDVLAHFFLSALWGRHYSYSLKANSTYLR